MDKLGAIADQGPGIGPGDLFEIGDIVDRRGTV